MIDYFNILYMFLIKNQSFANIIFLILNDSRNNSSPKRIITLCRKNKITDQLN